MIEDVLAAVQDLFGGDVVTMVTMAVIFFGSALFVLFTHFRNSREAVARRVSGEAQKAPGGPAPSEVPAVAVKKAVGSFVDKLGKSAGQTEGDTSRVLRSRLIQAGFYDREAVVWFFGLRLAGLAAGAALTFGGGLLLAPQSTVVALSLCALLGGMLGFVAPSFALDKRIKRFQLEHSSGFPDFMDLMVVCAQAGLSMEASINRIAAELSIAYPSLARNLDITAREIRSGKSLASAIESLSKRLGIQEAASFSTLLQQSEELGSSLTQSLRTYSDDMRNKRLMKAEEKAYALPAKLVVPLTLFVFPVLLVVLMLPVVVSVSGVNV